MSNESTELYHNEGRNASLSLRPDRGAEYCDQLVCVCVCVCLTAGEHVCGSAQDCAPERPNIENKNDELDLDGVEPFRQQQFQFVTAGVEGVNIRNCR